VSIIGIDNILFDSKKQARLFREDVLQAITELYTPCESEHDFIAKLASLVSLFEVPLDPLRRLLPEADSEWRSIKLVEQWLSNNSVSYDSDMITTWKNIVSLRNMTPLHSKSRAGELTSILNYFGEKLPPNYQRLWDSILKRFHYSLKELQRILDSL
jgi:hypothetical protein